MHSAKKQKVASFYSKSLPRPTVLLDKDDNPVKDRVDAPQPVTAALLGKKASLVQSLAQHEETSTETQQPQFVSAEWAKHAPANKGGAKPVYKGTPSACLTAFGAMVCSGAPVLCTFEKGVNSSLRP